MNEIWTDIPTMPNYSISTFGNLKRNGTSITTPVNKIGYKRKNIHIPIIREAIAAGISLTSIAKYFNVSQSAVSLIKTGKNWSTI